MTRARQSLSLIAPLKFHVTAQHPQGDRHVYGARSRFLTDRLLATMASEFHGGDNGKERRFGAGLTRRIDVAEELLDRW
jgi:DNA helicase-2/ATP-dependent DNA helicase PcrA